ncbi:hypothetical protein ACIRP3_34320 [Streptomyces sp. NPDC101209]|uniref:hypothetical protein n=1 Tax=Streptomyces sp. NPDC101209 TaxID=3366129 RepID=UPI0038233A3B
MNASIDSPALWATTWRALVFAAVCSSVTSSPNFRQMVAHSLSLSSFAVGQS